MQKFSGVCNGDFLILHGGAGAVDPKGDLIVKACDKLEQFAAEQWEVPGQTALDVVAGCLLKMEEDPAFNAGLGGCLQHDGKVRLTSGLMNGDRQSFSGVINIEGIRSPSALAMKLQNWPERVICPPGTDLVARHFNVPHVDNIIPERWAQWEAVKHENTILEHDTVGAVVKIGNTLVAGTSTGGLLNVKIGRVSDSGTVAGTYASQWAAVSATGEGEEIVDDALAARMETRVRDGMKLIEASERAVTEGLERQRQYGWIALSQTGEWVASTLTDGMPFVVFSRTEGLRGRSA